MSLFNNRDSGRLERAKMEDAAKYARKDGDLEAELLEKTGDAKFAKTYRKRGKLYDRINVSLHTMDIIIYVIVALIVLALIIGIAIG